MWLHGVTGAYFHSFRSNATAEGSPRPAGSGPAAIVERPPSLGRKRKSALNQCISKEASGKNTSAARMLSNYFFSLSLSLLLLLLLNTIALSRKECRLHCYLLRQLAGDQTNLCCRSSPTRKHIFLVMRSDKVI